MRDKSRSVFQTVKKLTRIFQPRTVAIKDVNGIKQTEPEKVCQQWKEYCEGLYDDKEENLKTNVQEREPPPLKVEIRLAQLRLSKQKATGPDEVEAVLLKFGEDVTLYQLQQICTEVWDYGIWPEKWTRMHNQFHSAT